MAFLHRIRGAAMTDTRTPWQIGADRLIAKWQEEDRQIEITVDAELQAKVRHGKRTAPQIRSERHDLYVRFDFENPEHREYAWLHPKRVINSEETGKLLKFWLPVEADQVIDRASARGKMPVGVTKRGDPPPTNLPQPTLESELIK